MTITQDSKSPAENLPIRDARLPFATQTASDVKQYYEDKTAAYMEGFGEVFQGSRPRSTADLLNYIMKAARFYEGMKVLDAGCGVGGPAVWFAEHGKVQVESLTISPLQVAEAKKRVAAHGVGDRVTVREGDFHKLSEIYPANSFDRVVFLETICHAQNYRQVLEEVWKVLKPGGFLYIKDFYCPDFRSKPELREIQLKDLEALNRVYHLVMPDLPSTIDLVQEMGFQFIYLREPEYEAVFEPWMKFESIAGLAWNPTLSYLDLIAGMEILVRKPLDRP